MWEKKTAYYNRLKNGFVCTCASQLHVQFAEKDLSQGSAGIQNVRLQKAEVDSAALRNFCNTEATICKRFLFASGFRSSSFDYFDLNEAFERVTLTV